MLTASQGRTVGLKTDGTAVTVGRGLDKENNVKTGLKTWDVSEWTGVITAVSGSYHAVGLRANGTVVAVGSKDNGRCDVADWKDIVAVSSGGFHTVGLKADGTVVASGSNRHGQCDVADWKDVVAIAAGSRHTAGLKADGTLLRTGERFHSTHWKDIVAMAVAGVHDCVLGLKSDGTVVVAGDDELSRYDVDYPMCVEVRRWTDIVAIASSIGGVIGLKADGTVVSTKICWTFDVGDVANWRDIVAVAVHYDRAVGLRADGTVVATQGARNRAEYRGECDVEGWKLFNHIDTLPQELVEAPLIAREKREEEERIRAQRRQAGVCQHCGGELKGLFGKKCVNCGKPKDY